MDTDGSQDDVGPTWPHKDNRYDMNGKIMLGAVISLSVVIIVVLVLHIYARCAMRRRRQHGATVHQLPLQHRHVDPNTGLEPTVIASLPLFVVKDVQLIVSDCAVCLSDLEAGEEARLLPNCKHTFHVECVDRWLGNQSNCPICRTEVAPWAVDVIDEALTGPPVEEEGGSAKELGGSSSRLSSFRRMISRDWSSRRIQQQFGVQDVAQDLERQS